MSCGNNNQREGRGIGSRTKTICCCDQRFTFNLTENNNDRFTLTVTPCELPTAVFDVATITVRENTCNQIEYYQIAINTDPVEIIQDCDLECGICRAIERYFDDATLPTCNNNNRRNGWFF